MLTCALIAAQIIATRKAGGSYHVMMVYPLPHMLVALAIGDLRVAARSAASASFGSRGLAALATAAIVAITASNLAMDAGYLRYFAAEGGRGYGQTLSTSWPGTPSPGRSTGWS